VGKATELRGKALLRWAAGGLALVTSLTAALGAEGGNAGPLRFVVYGASEGDGDAQRALVGQMIKLKPELVVHAGGLVENRRREADWDAFDAVTKPLRDLCPFYPCPGPGEVGTAYASRFQLPSGSARLCPYYSFDRKGVHFVVLDSRTPARRDDPQTRWLAADLEAAKGRLIFVFFYDPIHSVTGRASHGGTARIFWHPLFVRNQVRAALSGGHHIYYRTAQDGVHYLITGGGGAPLDAILARRNLLPTDVAGSFHHCIEITVAGDRVRGRVVDTEGKTRDEFELPSLPPKPPAPEKPRPPTLRASRRRPRDAPCLLVPQPKRDASTSLSMTTKESAAHSFERT